MPSPASPRLTLSPVSAGAPSSVRSRHPGVEMVSTPRSVLPQNGTRRPGHLSLTRLGGGDSPATPAPPGTVSIYVSGSGGGGGGGSSGGGGRSPAESIGSSSRLSLRWSGSSSTGGGGSLERAGARSRVSVSPAGATLVTIGPDAPESPPPAARRVRRVPILLEASGVELI